MRVHHLRLQISKSSTWRDGVRTRIRHSDLVIVICGKKYGHSSWCSYRTIIAQEEGKNYFLLGGYSSGATKSYMYFFTGQKAILQEIFSLNLFMYNKTPSKHPLARAQKTIFQKREVVFAFGRN